MRTNIASVIGPLHAHEYSSVTYESIVRELLPHLAEPVATELEALHGPEDRIEAEETVAANPARPQIEQKGMP